jgi:hypothetical protein
MRPVSRPDISRWATRRACARQRDNAWSGTADWADGAPLQVVQGHPEGHEFPQGTPNQAGFSPDHDPAEMFDIAKRLMRNM